MPFTFNAVELCVVIINEKPWTHAKEVCKALEYDAKTSKTANIIRGHCSPENITQKYQMSSVHAACTPINCPKDSEKYDIYTNEEGMYELPSQQLKAEEFRKRCCNVLFPHIWQQLTNKMKEDHQQAIEEKDALIALMNDDLQIQAIKYDNVALQTQRDVYKDQLQKYQDIITHLKIRHVPHAKDPGKDNIVMIIEKNNVSEEDELYEYPYYIARIQRSLITTKKRWFKAQYPHHRFIIEEVDNANSIHPFTTLDEKGYLERFQCHFRLVDIPLDVFYALATPAIQE